MDVQQADLNPWAGAPKVVSQEWVQEIVKAYRAQTERLQAIVDVLEPFEDTVGGLSLLESEYEKEEGLAIREALKVAREGLK